MDWAPTHNSLTDRPSLYCLTIDATKSKKETLKFNVDTYKYTDGKLIVNNTQINNVKDFSYYNNTLTVHIVENSDLAILCALSTLFSGAILLLTIIFSTLDAWYNDESFWFIDNE